MEQSSQTSIKVNSHTNKFLGYLGGARTRHVPSFTNILTLCNFGHDVMVDDTDGKPLFSAFVMVG